MRVAGFALALVLVAAAFGFGVRGGSGTSGVRNDEISTPPATGLDGTEVGSPPILEDAGRNAGQSAGQSVGQDGAHDAGLVPQERTRQPDSTRRSRRGRFRSVYPGPIPTPEEWEPPEGPVRIGLQVGHWKAEEAPDELAGIRDNGTRWGAMMEWEANLEVAREAAAQLQDLGYTVDLLPAVVPPSYRAHLFISVHSDGSSDPRASGFRVAEPRRDPTGRASGFADLLQESYGKETGLVRLPTVTHRMQNYYTFNFRRYEHALHPMTIGVIIETGYLTSARDRSVIVDDPGRAARGIVEAVKAFRETPPPNGTSPAGGGADDGPHDHGRCVVEA